MNLHRNLGLLAFSFVLATSTALGNVRDLRWRYSGVTNDLHAATSGGGKMVVVGSQGVILTSVDTLTWTPQVSGTTNDLWGVAYGNGLFVAVGGGTNGEIMTSPDGITWTRQTPGITNALRSVCCGTTSFVAVGTQGAILASTNGTTWSRRPTGLPRNLYAVMVGNTYQSGPLYLTVGEAGSLLSSIDGWSWTVRNSGVLLHLYCVTSVETRRGDTPVFMAAGQEGIVTASGNGINWTAITTPAEQDVLAAAGAGALGNGAAGTFALGGPGGSFICSDDGSSWRIQTSWSPANIRGLCHLDGEFLAVGDHGMIGCGLVWFRRVSNITTNLYAAVYGGGRYVAVGSGGAVSTSVDAQMWTPLTVGGQDLNAIAYGAGRFVAVGNGLAVAVSTNGLNWTHFTLTPPPGTLYGLRFIQVAYGNGAFIASGCYNYAADLIALSTNGLDWQIRTDLPPGYYNGYVAPAYAGPNTFFLCGSSINTSSDGITWTPRVNVAVPTLAASSNLFLGLSGGSSVYSPDGTNWTVTPAVGNPTGPALTYGAGYFMTVGNANAVYASYGSTDGITWIGGIFTEVNLQNIAYGDNCFIVVGNNGQLLQSSPSVLPSRLQTNRSTNGLNLVLISEPGRAVDLQTSSDLRSWGFWTNVTPTDGATAFPVSMPPGQQKFFRALAH